MNSEKILSKIKCPSDLRKLSIAELTTLKREIRETIISVVSKNGGHLSPNLGVVELTLALHLAFEIPKDQIVFDVSHQSYTHKLLTGRYDRFDSIRKKGGISGYCNIKESDYDAFGAGHASTSISSAVGLKIAKDLKKEEGEVICVIGDGALTGGMAFEALNHLSHLGKKIIIIINDNERSISENIGAMPRMLNDLRTSKKYIGLKKKLRYTLPKIPCIGNAVKSLLRTAKGMLKQALISGMFFENLGLTYVGIIDGHNIEDLLHNFKIVKDMDGPVVVHVLTQKGRGYAPAFENPGVYHGVSAFSIEKGLPSKKTSKTFSEIFGSKIIELAKQDKDVCAVTAAMAIGSGLCEFAEKFPDRFFDVGIAEEHAMTLSAGMARNGLKPYFSVYSTFLQRAYDQLIHDVCLQNLPVRICLDRAGIVGNDGPTHHGVFDLPLLLSIPNLEILSPSNAEELEYSMDYSLKVQSPIIIRYPRAKAIFSENNDKVSFEPVFTSQNTDITIVCFGSLSVQVYETLEKLKEKNFSVSIVKLLRLKPIDFKELSKKFLKARLIVSVEDSQVSNGFGVYFANELRKNGIKANFMHLGYPDKFIEHGNIDELNEMLGLDSKGITESIIKKAKDHGM